MGGWYILNILMYILNKLYSIVRSITVSIQMSTHCYQSSQHAVSYFNGYWLFLIVKSITIYNSWVVKYNSQECRADERAMCRSPEWRLLSRL